MNIKKTFVVLEPVEHDGERYTPGSPIELHSKDALPLLAVRAIAEPSAEDGLALQQAQVLDLDQLGELDKLTAELGELVGVNQQLNVQLRDADAALEASEAALAQARDDIQSLQTAKAEAASELAQLQAQHLETARAKSQLAGEVDALQAKLAVASAATKTTVKK